MYARERADGLYHSITYLLAKMVDEMLILAVLCLGLAAYTFWGVKLQGEWPDVTHATYLASVFSLV